MSEIGILETAKEIKEREGKKDKIGEEREVKIGRRTEINSSSGEGSPGIGNNKVYKKLHL